MTGSSFTLMIRSELSWLLLSKEAIMTNLWLLLLVVGLIISLLHIKKMQQRIDKLERWRLLIEEHAATVPDNEYV